MMALTLPNIDAYISAIMIFSNFNKNFKKRTLKLISSIHPMSITQIEKTFSLFVFGEILPNPTLVKLPLFVNKKSIK